MYKFVELFNFAEYLFQEASGREWHQCLTLTTQVIQPYTSLL